MCKLLKIIFRVYIIIIYNLQFYSYDYKDFLADISNANLNKNNDSFEDNMKLKEELNNYKKENEELKYKISKLNNELILANKTLIDFKNNYYKEQENNKNKINNYNDLIEKKDKEISELKSQLEKTGNNKKYVNFNDIMVINFISSDQKLNTGIQCLKTETFAEVEERLYQQYEEYRENNNNFISNGRLVLRFKKIWENNIKNLDKVQLIDPTQYD